MTFKARLRSNKSVVTRSRSLSASSDADKIVGPLESIEVAAPDSVTSLEDTGAVASVLLGVFILYRAVQYLVEHRYHLVYPRRLQAPLDLTPVLYAYLAMSLFLFSAARRFSKWFAPAGIGQKGRIVLAALGFLLISECFQPLVMAWRYNYPATGRWGNIFSINLDSSQATYGPLFLGAVILLAARFIPKVIVPIEPSQEPTDNGSGPIS